MHILQKILCAATLLLCCPTMKSFGQEQARKYDVAAYVYPGYAADDPRLRTFWPMGIGEWETVMNMQDRYPGHYWNRKPLWGYVNEADPAVMEMEIEEATNHGVNVFIFDWYWYDGRPFMETTLTNGFLKAPNVDKMQFYLMWANHDWSDFVDTRLKNDGVVNNVWEGGIDREEFEKICKRNIEMFFKHPQYYKIDGKPVFMIYDIPEFISGMGGYKEAADALKWFDKEVKKAGFPGLDLHITMWAPNLNYSGVDAGKTDNPENEFVRKLGFTGGTHYQFAHFTNADGEYLDALNHAQSEWNRITENFDMTFYPHISIGWDNSPRTGHSAVLKNNTPENFEKGLRMAKEFVDKHPAQAPLITINSWNEWTESSYLEPCTVNGYGYLDAVKRVFKP